MNKCSQKNDKNNQELYKKGEQQKQSSKGEKKTTKLGCGIEQQYHGMVMHALTT